MEHGDGGRSRQGMPAKPREELRNVAKNIADCTGDFFAYHPYFLQTRCTTHVGLDGIERWHACWVKILADANACKTTGQVYTSRTLVC